MYALIDISNQMLEDSAFDHAGASLRKAGLAVAINEMLALKLMQVFSILVMCAPPPFVSVYGLPSQRLSKIEHGRAHPRRARLFCCTG